MKTILIETVSNGWIVRPFQPSAEWVCTETPAMAVYTDLAVLQRELPELLQFEGYMNAAPPTSEEIK